MAHRNLKIITMRHVKLRELNFLPPWQVLKLPVVTPAQTWESLENVAPAWIPSQSSGSSISSVTFTSSVISAKLFKRPHRVTCANELSISKVGQRQAGWIDSELRNGTRRFKCITAMSLRPDFWSNSSWTMNFRIEKSLARKSHRFTAPIRTTEYRKLQEKLIFGIQRSCDILHVPFLLLAVSRSNDTFVANQCSTTSKLVASRQTVPVSNGSHVRELAWLSNVVGCLCKASNALCWSLSTAYRVMEFPAFYEGENWLIVEKCTNSSLTRDARFFMMLRNDLKIRWEHLWDQSN